MSLDALFASCELDILAVEDAPSLPSPLEMSASLWRASVSSSEPRIQAFYDENLEFYFTLQFPASDHDDPACPAPLTLSLLSHLQLGLEASYIPYTPFPSPHEPQSPLAPTSASPDIKSKLPPSLAHSSIFPPNTPRPVPQTAERDTPYINSEGTILTTYILGERNKDRDAVDTFSLLWDEDQRSWLAIYKLDVGAAFMAMRTPDPLLCITVSVTLRDVPTPLASVHDILNQYAPGISHNFMNLFPIALGDERDVGSQDYCGGHLETNLLGELSTGPTLGRSLDHLPLYLPTSRISSRARKQTSPLSPNFLTGTTIPTASRSIVPAPVLRKSFRKTFKTLSGFHLRMLTILVPYMVIPSVSEEEDAWIGPGSEERTVVLCIEVETKEHSLGFSIENADIKISGDGATAHLISWGDKTRLLQACEVFPLHIPPHEQFNLLYAISFYHGGDGIRSSETLPPTRNYYSATSPIRNVSIVIQGRPYTVTVDQTQSEKYLTNSFTSRWNSILDLSTMQRASGQLSKASSLQHSMPQVLPLPPSPFPNTVPSAKGASVPMRYGIANTWEDARHHSFEAKGNFYDKPLPPLAQRTLPSSHDQRRRTILDISTSVSKRSSQEGINLLHLQGRGGEKNTEAISDRSTLLAEKGLTNLASDTAIQPEASSGYGRVLVSVQLVPPPKAVREARCVALGQLFDVEIFVLNESSWTRKFELCFRDSSVEPAEQRVGRDQGPLLWLPEIIELENHVRVGPLRPGTCQSVRMQFVALKSGTHIINGFSIVDVQTGYTVALHSAIELVVQESQNIQA